MNDSILDIAKFVFVFSGFSVGVWVASGWVISKLEAVLGQWIPSLLAGNANAVARVSSPAVAPQRARDAIPWLWEQVDALQAKVDELKGDLVVSDSRAQAALAHAEASNEAFVAIQHEQQRLIDALQDAITLLEGKPAKWAELAPDYGIDPIAYRPDTLKKAAIDEFRALILEVTTPTIDAPAPVAEATAEASAS